MQDKKADFSHVSELYKTARPTYSEKYLDSIPKGLNIAEFGAGTGKLTSQILEEREPNLLIAVEPNLDMSKNLYNLTRTFQSLKVINDSAENAKLEKDSVDRIIVAQAFHWFDWQKFLDKTRYILKDDGKVNLVWNRRGDSIVNNECRLLFEKYCPDFKGFGGGIWNNLQPLENFFQETGYKMTEYENPLIYRKNDFINRNLTGSYIPVKDKKEYLLIKEGLEEIFNKYADDNGQIVMDNTTVVYENIKSFKEVK
ncbi:class I SAM-dependent methyltransferase [Floricoccus penangensis]|uniref:class I SAM-dependent methyltransferase n=1 Tax=Floricoccus penangensis TaxID=1859475 RepID=UPI002040496B|nr:class I SAM-dependent methyltransferase [Floricoccus penangensis]URZ87089.1 methyltransferase [Floricoccus penangensis]